MSNLGAQLKGMNWKEFFINHCEKLVLVFVGLFVMASLGTTRWKAYPTQPEEIDDKVKASKAAYLASRWPEENQKDFQARDLGDVVAGVTQEIPARPNDIYSLGNSWVRPIYPPKLKRGEINWLGLEEPIADAGKILLAFVAAPTTPSGQPLVVVEGSDGAPKPSTGDLDDDFRPRGVDGPRTALGIGGQPMPMPAPSAGHTAPGPMPVGGKPKKGAAGKAAAGPGHGGSPDPSLLGFADGMSGGMPSSAGTMMRPVEAKGYRFVSVRAVFPLKQQLEEIRKTLQLETTSQAWDQMRFGDFKIQRQTALAGNKPWGGKWEDVDIQTALDILGRVDFDVDVVEEKYRDPVITMPLPFRQTGRWQANVSHPRIRKLLSEEEAARQEAINRAAIETAEKMKLKSGGGSGRGGFNGVQHNTRDIQRQILGNSSATSAFNEIYNNSMGMEMMGSGSMMPPGMGGGHGAGGSMMTALPPPGMGGGHGPNSGSMMPAGSGMMPPGMGGMNGMSGMGMAGGAVQIAIPDVLLFRYLDFDVIPGNAYRYRIQLVMRNPNFGADAVDLKDPSSANGEFREGKFSPPTNPVVIEDELKIFLSSINAPANGNLTANMEVFQWLTDSGSYVMGPITKLARGDQLSAVTSIDPKTQEKGGGLDIEVLRPANNSFKKERIDFETPNLILNMAVNSVVDAQDNPDLGLPNRKISVKLEEVVMVNRFGEIIDIDNVSTKAAQTQAAQRIKNQDDAFKHLKMAAPGTAPGGLEGYLGSMQPPGAEAGPTGTGKGGPKIPKRTGSALKRGAMGAGSAGSMGSGMMPMGGA